MKIMESGPWNGTKETRLRAPTGTREQQATRLKQAADEFEALCIEQLMKAARPKSAGGAGAGLFGKSFAMETFQDMSDQVLAHGMAQRGAFGLSRIVKQQISQKIGIKESS